jgi:ABC-type Zn uptake system ZnuABC Zn-binding protein ZnuA
MATRVLDLVHVSLAEQADPVQMAAIEAQAKRDGLHVVLVAESHASRVVRESAADTSVRTIPAGNGRAFLDNLRKIATGRVRVAS